MINLFTLHNLFQLADGSDDLGIHQRLAQVFALLIEKPDDFQVKLRVPENLTYQEMPASEVPTIRTRSASRKSDPRLMRNRCQDRIRMRLMGMARAAIPFPGLHSGLT